MIRKILTLISVAAFTFFSASGQHRYEVVDSGFVFTNPPFKSCHSPSITELDNGTVLCAWFGGDHEGNNNVSIWSAEFKDAKWSNPVKVADGIVNDTLRFACWNPVLYNQKGVLYLFYKIGKSPSSWHGVYKKSKDNGQTWSSAKKLPDGILGAIKNKPIRVGRRILNPSSTETEGNKEWKSFIEISDTKFQHWKKVPIDTASSYKVIQPTLLNYGNSRIQALLRSDSNEILQSWSSDNGKTWSKISSTHIQNPNSGIDAVDLHNGKKLLVYNPTEKGRDWWDGRNKLAVMETQDGVQWNTILSLENHEKGEFSYPAIIQLKNKRIFIAYTYDRRNIKYVIVEQK